MVAAPFMGARVAVARRGHEARGYHCPRNVGAMYVALALGATICSDMVLANIITAFGLSGAAGLNAYIPLLIVAVLGRMEVIKLSQPFDVLTSWPAIGALVILLVIEVVVDKVPGADHVNDAIQTFVRPAAGAVLFAANAGVITGLDPAIGLIAGLVMALSVHAAKAATRPVVNATTLGVGAPVISVAEDILSAVGSILAIFFPLLFVLFAAALGYAAYRVIRKARSLRRPKVAPTITP